MNNNKIDKNILAAVLDCQSKAIEVALELMKPKESGNIKEDEGTQVENFKKHYGELFDLFITTVLTSKSQREEK